MTAVDQGTFTASQFNMYIRDNLLETLPGKASSAARNFVTTGLNSVSERVPSYATVDTKEGTATTSFVDLATVGPSVTVATGTSAIVWFAAHCDFGDIATTGLAYCVPAVTGATVEGPGTEYAIAWGNLNDEDELTCSKAHLFTALTAGTNTFTLKYQAPTMNAGNCSWERRQIMVLPL
jgi:hypothetical protein